jgi:hypothetical protein
VSAGALAGALMSVQFTGLPLAIASHGYSVAIGAGVGGTIGLIGALKRKGKISSLYPGDTMKLTVAEPVTLPGFNLKMLPSAAPIPRIKDLSMQVKDYSFKKDRCGDSHSRLLSVDVCMENNTKVEYSFFDLAVVSDYDQRYYPTFTGDFKLWKKKVSPGATEEATITFSVDSPKRKYWLVLLDRRNREDLARIPIN